jgi:hypothetical protein
VLFGYTPPPPLHRKLYSSVTRARVWCVCALLSRFLSRPLSCSNLDTRAVRDIHTRVRVREGEGGGRVKGF